LTGDDKGTVEAAVRYATGRWWRTLAAPSAEAAQLSLDRFWATTGDARRRSPSRIADLPAEGGRPRWPTVGELADTEPLLGLPAAPFPATVDAAVVVDHQATVAFRGNRYSVPPGLASATVVVRQRVGHEMIDVVAGSGTVLVTHRCAPDGSGALVRSVEHRAALERAVLSAFSTARPCDRKANRPPSGAARAERAKLAGPAGADPAVDLDAMAEVIRLAFPGATEVNNSEVGA
jgi:hypothetical protein